MGLSLFPTPSGPAKYSHFEPGTRNLGIDGNVRSNRRDALANWAAVTKLVDANLSIGLPGALPNR